MRHTTLTPACVLCVLVIFVGTLSGATGRLEEAVFTVNNVDRVDGVDPGHHSYRMLEGVTATFNCTATGYRHGDTLTISVGAGDNLNVTKTHNYTSDILNVTKTHNYTSDILNVTKTHNYTSDILNVTESQTVTYTIHNVTCADMGTYTCTVGHTGQRSHDINIHLLIWHCPPQLCRVQHHQQTITAVPYRPADVSFCVVTHPVHTPHPLLKIGDTTLTPGGDDPLYIFNWTHLGGLYHTVQLHIKNVTQFQYMNLVLFTSERKVLAHRIKVRPDEKIEFNHQVDYNNSELILTCKATGYPIDVQISSRKNQTLLSLKNNTKGDNSRRLEYVEMDLSCERHMRTFECRATSIFEGQLTASTDVNLTWCPISFCDQSFTGEVKAVIGKPLRFTFCVVSGSNLSASRLVYGEKVNIQPKHVDFQYTVAMEISDVTSHYMNRNLTLLADDRNLSIFITENLGQSTTHAGTALCRLKVEVSSTLSGVRRSWPYILC
ncbi:uncharacterized protein LOC131947821 [Physella acuta]|uniref:uncharacterized protein LOC131947821 n=1 Tax=Physella acuta TaxID=109671 RepID=UPI0027DE8234|nr:uncharacterized protein LOC131947821 [Physella acuta]